MSSLKYPHLFEPFEIRGTMFRNRIFASPQGYYNVPSDNLLGGDAIAFFERKAIGGFASVCVAECIVDSPDGMMVPFLIRMDDSHNLPSLSAAAHAITRHGAVAAAELNHHGMYAQCAKNPLGSTYISELEKSKALRSGVDLTSGIIYGPVDKPDGKYGEVREMPEEMILCIIEAFGQAAAWAKRCGYGMVTVHGGHGWLLSQFVSPQINTRRDQWGGSFENRMRLPLAIVDSIRRHVGPKFPIEYRFSGSECDPDGYDISEGIKIAQALDQKVDIIHVSAGNHELEDTFIITHPSMFLPDGCNVRFAAEVKQHVKSPVATVGALTSPDQMEEIIASGQADIVVLGRQTLADPDLPIKARTGRDDEINKCMRCYTCFGNSFSNRILRCAINPAFSHEAEERCELPAWDKKKVLVAGGGVGGMQAALTAAGRGHEVILCEKSDRLGGVLTCEEKVPFKQHLDEYLKRQAARIDRTTIDLRLNTAVTPELARSLAPDVIIAAIGARPAVPPIPGIDGKTVLSADALYRAPEKGGKCIVILGGGLVGLELAIFMARQGRKVTVVEMMDRFTVQEFNMHTTALKVNIRELGIQTHLSTKALHISDAAVTCEDGEGRQFDIPADTVVYATGQVPKRAEAFALNDCAPEFYMLGDCRAPQNIAAATASAYAIARDIGRRF
jgi:2,4-dienoyl-CoA reductase-like NADH-dependent reductase (Old Yellow Enzyme family)/thioredoxin reductase